MKETSDFKIKNLEIKEYKNKYRLAAEEIYHLLGEGNYANVYNCMTRFRANITDKNLVNIDALKKIPLVKGINWAGNQIQIIIGGEVIKVHDEFKKYEGELAAPRSESSTNAIQIKEKKSFGNKAISFITGVMGPSIIILLAAGMFSALYSLLTIEGAEVLQTKTAIGIPISMNNINDFDIWSGLMFILNKILLNSIGLIFIYNTARYLKGDTWLALAVGIILLSRAFFPGTGAPLENAKFGSWIYDTSQYNELGKVIYTGTEKMGYLLFTIGSYPIVVGGYESSIIVFIVGGAAVVYLDKWIKTWMPPIVDIIFRPFLVIGITMFGLWFLLAPISSLIEYGLSQLIQLFGKIPYGFGTALIALFYQPLVLTGAHVAAIMPLVTDMINTGGSTTLPPIACAVWGQVGAVIGIAIMTKNANLRRLSISTIPAGIFGVTEPIMYGVTLPKFRPFIMGCLGGAVGGLVSGILEVTGVRMSGSGILAIIAAGGDTTLIWQLLLTWGISIIAATLFVVLTYKERKNELSTFKKGINKLIKFSKMDKAKINNEFENELNTLKAMKNDYQKVTKYYSEVSKFENQLLTIENKESKQREKMYQELVKLQTKLAKKNNKVLLAKFNNLNAKYSTYNLDNEKAKIQNQLDKVINSNKELINNFQIQKESIYQHSLPIIENKELTDTQKLITQNIMWDAINSVEIGFGIEDAKPIKFKKEMK